MKIYAVAVYLFLYIPIAVIAVFSFNAGRYAAQMQGFSTQWYGKALSNPFVMEALQTSVTVALSSAVLANSGWHHGGLGVAGRQRQATHYL